MAEDVKPKLINPYMENREKRDWQAGTTINVYPYIIQAKKDFGKQGYYDAATRSTINMGWIVTKDGANAIPGAGWFHTLAEAGVGMNVHILSDGDADRYHAMYSALSGMAKSVLVKSMMGQAFLNDRDGGNEFS